MGEDASCNRQMFSKFCVLAGEGQNLQVKTGFSARLPCTQNLNTLQYNLHTVALLTGNGCFLQQTDVFKVLRTCRQMAKFANEKRRFGEVTLHAKFKHVAIQFAHRV